jgi:small subunit ribosomal protein S5
MAFQRNFRKNREADEGPNRLIDLRRVARVVKGGRRFSFRATVVAGNKAGSVGIGVAKGIDTALSIQKALRNAKRSFISVPLTKAKSLPFEVDAKYGSSRLLLKPARAGRGLVAGGAVRTVLDFAGVENASAKILSRGTNKLNNAKATIEALKKYEKYASTHTKKK